MNVKKIPVLSFFTGAGFLDMGFEKAGFNICWTNEFNESFIKLYEYGYTSWRQAEGVTEKAIISEKKSIEDLQTSEIINKAFIDGMPEHWGIIGGPPCPDFSNGGSNNGFSGENGKLTSTFIYLILKLKPSFFLIENVTGLYRIKKHRKFLDILLSELDINGYKIDLKIVNSIHFNVPQDRPRLFIVGIERALFNNQSLNKEWFPFPEGCFPDYKSFNWPKRNHFGSKLNSIKGLPHRLTITSIFDTDPSPEELPNGMEYFNSKSDKFKLIDEGDTSRKSFKRLHRYRYSPTACYGNNEVHLHPSKPRRLSVREVLRIQGIPDSYVLPKNLPLSSKFKFISNGVPMPLAYNIAISLKNFLSNEIKD